MPRVYASRVANFLHDRSTRQSPGRFRDAQVVEARHIWPCRFVDLTVDPDRRIRDLRNIDRPAVAVTRVEMQAPIARILGSRCGDHRGTHGGAWRRVGLGNDGGLNRL